MQETQKTIVVPTSFKMGEQEYYNSKDLLAYKPEFYYGCTSKPRNIISRKNIPKEEYAYATFEKLTKKWNRKCREGNIISEANSITTVYNSATTTMRFSKRV
jgi:hypothetical protein